MTTWNNFKISTKFSIGFGFLLFTLLSIAGAAFFSLQHIHSVETTIVKNIEIQRLVLSMDRNLQRAKYLHSSYFQNYHQIGLKKAHETYALASIRETAKAIGLSTRLQELLHSSDMSASSRLHLADLNLYLASAKRFAKTSILSYELFSTLVAPGDGLEIKSTQLFSSIEKELLAYPRLQIILEQMHASLRQYAISKKRPFMQSMINDFHRLQREVAENPSISNEKQVAINQFITRFLSINTEIVTINEQIKSVFNDFSLQEENLSTTAHNLLLLATREVDQAQLKIDRTRRATQQLNLLLSGIGFGISLTIIWLLNRSISSRILELTKTAEQLRGGDLEVRFHDTSADELGTLAQVFSSMTSQRSADIKELHHANFAMQQIQDSLEETVAHRTNELQKLLKISHSLSVSNSTRSLYRVCTSLSKELLQFDFSTLMILAEDKKHLIIQDTIGLPEASIGTFSLVKGQGLSTLVVEEKKAGMVADFHTEKRFDIPPIVLAKKVRSALCAPMMIGDEVFGVLIGHTLEKRHFSDNEVSLYCSLANQSAVAIANTLHIEEIRDSEKKFHTFFDNANDAIIIFDVTGSIVEANTMACDSLGYSHPELLGLSSSKLIASDFLPEIPQHLKAINHTGKQIFESAYLTQDGIEIPVELNCTSLDFNKTPAILAIARDISERKKMEKELVKVERLESIGVLAGGIAHDFNNILASILGNINLARLDKEINNETQNLLEEAEKASIRARGLTRQLLTFSKGGDPIKEVTSLPQVIRDSADFILRGSNVSCKYRFEDKLWPVEIDKGQISQVIQNLVINARHAMPRGGKILVSCCNSKDPQAISHLANTGKHLKITIQDSGIGIPAQIIDKIFDPYFTTKQKGSGLGLAVSHSIIIKHGGSIFASSAPNEGTTFIIYLPATDTEPAQSLPSSSTAVSKPGETAKGMIMVMDDDPMILQVTTAILKTLGHQVVQAEDGLEAIGIFKENLGTQQAIDIIIMDLTIPGGMGGKDAVQEILKIDPASKVLVSSGYSNDPIMANFREYGFQGALNKPFHLHELQSKIEKLL